MIAHRRLGLALAGVAMVLAGGAGCKSAAPRGPQTAAGPARPDVLAGYVGQRLVLRHVGDAAKSTVKRSELASVRGECDVVVQVRQARFDRGTAVLTMSMLGRPRMARRGAREERCGNDQPQAVLTVSGLDAAASTADLEAALAPMLQTPEAYLRARGLAFDIPAGKAPGEATADHFVTVRPVRLLWVDPVRQDPAHRVQHEGEVEVEGVVGADGRFYDARLLGALAGSQDEQRVRELLPLWRFEPGKRGNDRVPVKVRERLVFRIF
jgi:hypothetical protein